jgi:hypothetical protein
MMGVALYQGQPALMFSGTMATARDCIMMTRLGTHNRAYYINNDVNKFIKCVSDAVEFLHLRRLVHMELSLDSVMVQVSKGETERGMREPEEGERDGGV